MTTQPESARGEALRFKRVGAPSSGPQFNAAETVLVTGARMARQVAILDAAERMFADRGVRSTSMSDIARLCRLAVRTVYSHFDGKKAILSGVFEQRRASYEAHIAKEFASSDPLEQLFELTERTLRALEENPPFLGKVSVASTLRNDNDDELRAHELSLVDWVCQRYAAVGASVLQRGIALGRIRSDVPVADLMWVPQAWIRAAILQWRSDPTQRPRLRADSVARMFLEGAGANRHA